MGKRNYKIFLGLVVLLPFAFGGLVPAKAVLLVDAVFLLLWWRQANDVRRKEGAVYRVPGMLPLFLLGILMACQLIPLPPGLLKLLSPKSWHLYHETIWVVRPETWMPLSVAPINTLQVFFCYCTCVFLYFFTVQALCERERIHSTITTLAVFAGFFSLAGTCLYFSGVNLDSRWLLWGSRDPRNWWQGDGWVDWTVAVFPLLFGLFLAFRPRVHYGTLGEKFLQFFKNPSAHQHLLHLALIPVIAIPLLIGSAAVVPTAGMAVFAIMVLAGRHDRKTGLGLLLVAALMAGTGIYGVQLIHQARTGSPTGPYEGIKFDSLRLVGDYAITGSGFGTFEKILPRYRADGETPGRAASDIFKFLGEGGVLGFLLGAWFLSSVVRTTFPRWLQRQNRTAVYLYPGALAGLTAVLVNGLIHLNNTNDVAAPMTFFFLAGVMVAVANIRSGGKNITDLATLNLRQVPWAPLFVIGILTLSLTLNGGILLGKHNLFQSAKADSATFSKSQVSRRIQNLKNQRMFDPLDAEYPYVAANYCLTLEEYDRAINFFAQAVRLAPLNGKYAQALGLALAQRGEDEKAEKLLQAGLKNDPFAAERHKEFALWLFSKKKTEQGLAQISHALSLSPEKTPTYLAMMNLYGVSEKQMRRVLPDNALSYAAFGNYLLAKGRGKPAEEMFRQAMQYAGKEVPDEDLFWQLYRYYSSRDRIDEALQVLQAGIRVFPKEADFRVLIAGVYEQLGISFRAIEEYRNALLLDPGNRSARERLAALEDR